MRPRTTRVACALFVVFTALATCALPASAGTTGSVREFKATADCTVDVTAALNGFIKKSANGSTIGFQAGACYRVNGTVVVADRANLTFEGRGARFEAETNVIRTGKHWQVTRGSNLVFRNLTVKGANPAGGINGWVGSRDGEAGFQFQGTKGVTLDHVNVTDTFGDFVTLAVDPANHANWTTNVLVTGGVFQRSGRQGVALTGVLDARIEHNTFDGVGRSMFDLEPDSGSGGAQRVVLSDNDLAAWANTLLPVSGRGVVTDITLQGNRLHGDVIRVAVRNLSVLTGASRRARISILDNTSDDVSKATAIYVQDTDGLVVRGNHQAFDPTKREPAVKTERTCGIDVSANDFPGAATSLMNDGYVCP